MEYHALQMTISLSESRKSILLWTKLNALLLLLVSNGDNHIHTSHSSMNQR